MRKLILTITFLLFACSASAVGYQVSCDLHFTDRDEYRNTVATLAAQETIGIGFRDQGDYLRSVDPNGPELPLRYLGRFADPGQRDMVWDFLQARRSYFDPNLSYQIEKHTCHGDNPSAPCTDQEIDNGGEE